MGSEVLLYGYGLVCLSMIVFNVIYSLIMRGSEHWVERRSGRLENLVEMGLEQLYQGEPLSQAYLKKMQHNLSHVNNLMVFDRVLNRYLTADKEKTVQKYLSHFQPAILYLALVYRKRDSLQAAYFAYFLNCHKLNQYMQMEAVQDILVEYMKKKSLYCRVNALKALCGFGSPTHIFQAVLLQDQNDSFLHAKILTECLLTYEGDHGRLIQLFWERLDQFSVRTQRALLDYIRFKSGDYQEPMFRLMIDPARNRELRFSAIRYFGRYVYPPAKEKLLAFLADEDPQHWEYAAISAMALAAYPGADVVDALIQAMHSGNWYVRYNAAASLEAQGVTYSDLIELVGGKDRYAREMILYRLESRRLKAAPTPEAVEALEEKAESEMTETVWN